MDRARALSLCLERYIGEGQKVEKIIVCSQTYIEILENDGSISENDKGLLVWNNPLPIRYEMIKGVKIPFYGNIPLIIDDAGPDWAIIVDAPD